MSDDGQTRLEPLKHWKDRYVIDRELSRGGFGIVYLARDEQLRSKPVVIKVLQQERHQDPYLQRKFQQEIEALARIDHPGVVGVLDVGVSPEGAPFLAMQYVEGVTLRAELRENGMDFSRVAEIVLQMGNALAAAHDKGIHHRDLKPENVMLARSSSSEEYVKLIDFVIAAVMDSQVDSSAQPSMVVGTLSYMAPEQALGKGGAPSDIYAFGVIAFEMLTGQKPNVSPEGVAVKPREIRADIPEKAEKLILDALQYSPGLRPASPRQLGEELGKALLSREATDAPTAPVAPGGTARVQDIPSHDLEIAYVLFLDIVGYSKLPMDLQRQRVQRLQEIVRSSAEFRAAQSSGQLVTLPTGDGMALAFFRPIAPVQCAIEIARGLAESPDIGLRMGIHNGPVYRIADINTNQNVAGGGINLAQRVMDCGDEGHILLSKSMAEILSQITDWSPLLQDLGETEVKHGAKVHLVNLVTEGAGNPETPEKLKNNRPRPASTNKRHILTAAGIALVLLVGTVLLLLRPSASPGTASPVLDTPTGKMILIPEGQYLAGADKRPVRLPAFYMDQTEVRNSAYAMFSAATGRHLPPDFPSDKPDFPVVNVTVDDAREFARWAGKRLPLLAEWEKAARGTDGRTYPWGNDNKFTGANVAIAWRAAGAQIAETAAFPQGDSPFGIRQMLGNVWELIDEMHSPSANALRSFTASGTLKPPPTNDEPWFLLVGGSIEEPAQPVYEFGYVPGRFHSERIGFRCAKDAK